MDGSPNLSRRATPLQLSGFRDTQVVKLCGKCRIPKPIDDFGLKNRRTGLRQSACKLCQNQISKEHYGANKAAYLAKAKRSNKKLLAKCKAIKLAYLLSHPCVDCGEPDPVVLQFDHPNDDKLADVSRLRKTSIRRMMAEIAKCEVRCANCHFRVTAKRRLLVTVTQAVNGEVA